MIASGERCGIARVPLARTGWSISRLGLGCASYWARPGFAEKRARAVVETALERGIDVFDTGASYGDGFAERRLARILDALDVDRDCLLVSTKVGTVTDTRGRLVKDFRPERIVAQVEKSLRRLNTDRIALLQLHGPHIHDLSDELLSTLQRLRADGKVALLGVNGFSEVIEHVTGCGQFDVVMPFISVVQSGNAGLAQQAAAAGQGVLAAGPLARMLFAPPLASWLSRPSGLWYLARALAGGAFGLARAQRFRKALRAPGWSPAQLALAWVLARPGVSCAVVGTTDPGHLRELADASSRTLPRAVEQAVAALGNGATGPRRL
ncbi:MAG: aldo/keto reductase [Xanthomonadaceae bacterium]|nr:aldo/keto reductase [Xanthomonadaceae bacterium]